MPIQNPFEILYSELIEIKSLLLEIKANQTAKEDFAEYPELLTRSEVAKMINVVITTVDRYAREGYFTKHYIGRSIRFKKSEVIQATKKFPKYQRN